jgi:glycosyltransferase involved in cell wall biosynthesis
MDVINQCDNSIYINDIDLIIPFSSTGEPFEVDPELVERSTILHICLAKRMIVDASKEKGVPGEYTRHQAMLSREDQFRHPDGMEPKKNPKSKKEDFPADNTYAIWHGPAFDFGGYANMNRRFMFGLNEMGDHIRYKELPSMKDAGPELAKKLSDLTRTKVPDWAPMVYGMTAPLCYHWEKYKVLFTMMETRTLHPHYVERCNSADEIVVPSHWCKEVFKESGVTKPMRVVPLGVDTSLYVPGAKPIGFSKGLKDFVFLSVFGWSMRKGYDVLLKSYFEEFTSDDPVSLVIMSRYKGSTDEHQKQVVRDDIARIASMVQNPKKPHVLLFGDTLSDEMMPRLYAAADCYVLISRGEGFGLPYCEAAACGLPVIGSRYSGQTDFLNDDNSYLVDVDGFRKSDRDISWISYFYEDAEFPILGPSAVEQTRVHMRDVFENRDKAREKADKLHGHIVENFDWSVGIKKMHDRLAELNDERRPK